MIEIYLLLAIILGFCLGRFGEIKKLTQEVFPAIEKRLEKKYRFSVISTNEAELEREQKEKEEKEKQKFKLNFKDFIKQHET